ncbi:hypothetical protein EZV62_007499 [Acer yangbiense]|uniref:Retroviral polymerase SH3-like domain-containing protein n=1 Tax=Acer yangbiense TaxID=1000413 RepID=A0A5C7IAL3_9ROSI|nr:hypothetical protein EZV62_007499 [Acer yangbiense]
MGYRLYNPITKKVIFSRDVIFEENESWNWDQTKASRSAELISEEETKEVATEPQIPRDQQTPQRGSSSPQRYDAPLPIERDFSDMMPRGTRSLEDLLIGYSDSDWGRDLDERKRTTGFTFFMGDTAFTWSSKKQAIVTLSSCEAEYVAACSAVCHGIWIRNVLQYLGFPQVNPTEIYIENRRGKEVIGQSNDGNKVGNYGNDFREGVGIPGGYVFQSHSVDFLPRHHFLHKNKNVSIVNAMKVKIRSPQAKHKY